MRFRDLARLTIEEARHRLGLERRRRDRVDLDSDGRVDDVVVGGVELVRFERLDACTWWGRLYMLDGDSVELSFYLDGGGLQLRVDGGPTPTEPDHG